LRFLCEQSGYVPEEVLGVGDSDVDLPFLELTGHSAAPANAFDSVKRIVEYIAPRRTSQGVRDILQHFGLPI
jgi:hydroxymethylpyrimidine pyrophosphatase-like HAD family hydrolase